MFSAGIWRRCLLGATMLVSILGTGVAQAEDLFKIYLRDLNGTPLRGCVVEAWEQLDSSKVDVRRKVATGSSTANISLGNIHEVIVGGSSVHVGEKLTSAPSNDDGFIEFTVNTSPENRAIVFFANRTGDRATAMVPFLVDATELESPESPKSKKIKDDVKTHILYIAVPKLPPVPSKQAPLPYASPQNAYTFAPSGPGAGSYKGPASSQALARQVQGS